MIMCQVLFLSSDLPNAGKFDGHPISVYEDDFVFPVQEDKRRWIAEGNPPGQWPDLYYIISFPGCSVAQGTRLLEKEIRGASILEPEYEAPDLPDRIITLGPIRWSLGPKDQLPVQLRGAIQSDGYAVIDWVESEINNYFVDRQVIPADASDGRTPGEPMDLFITPNPIRFYLDGQPVFNSDL